MKTYKTILIGIVVLIAVIYGGQKIMKSRVNAPGLEVVEKGAVKAVEGKVVRMFEGENVINYAFDIAETATSSVEKEGALIKVTEGDVPVSTMYISFEGARGYSPADYVKNLISPVVPSVTMVGTTTIGAHEWQKAESLGSEWYIASVLGGGWLIVVENKKTLHDAAVKILETLEIN